MRRNLALLLTLAALTISCLVIVEPVKALENSWMARPPMFEMGTGAVAVDGKVYVIGADGSVQQYDPAALAWTSKTANSHPTGNGIAVYQNKIYAIGGSHNDVYDVATDSWSSRAGMPTWREGVQANVVAGKIYVIGGLNDTATGAITDVNEAYDPTNDTWATKEPIPTPVYEYASAVVDNKIYIIGGSSTPPNIVSGLVQIYDPENNSWTTGAPMPTPVRMASAGATSGVLAPKRIYVMGGLQSGEGLNLNQVYDPQADSWTEGASMPTARYGLSVAVLNDTIYAMGGLLLPPYAFPKEPLTATDLYLPLGYDGPLPLSWQPSPSPSPSPTANPTCTPTNTPTLPPPSATQEPTETPQPKPEAFPIASLVAAVAVVAILVSISAAVYVKKRRHETSEAKPAAQAMITGQIT